MKVAAIVPTFQRDWGPIVRHFQAQTHPDKLLVLVDNNPGHIPADGSLWCESVAVVTPTRNLGAARGRNAGMALAIESGADALCFWDDDDVPKPEYMTTLAGILDAYPWASVAVCRVDFEGMTLPVEHRGTQGRMVRASVVNRLNARWPIGWPGEDKAWWAQFGAEPQAGIMDALIESFRNPEGGYRHPDAVKPPRIIPVMSPPDAVVPVQSNIGAPS